MEAAKGLKWLVYGHKGWIAQKYCNFLEEAGAEVIRAEARADDMKGVAEELDRHKPDRVVCIIGRTHGPGNGTIDWLEEKGRLIYNVRDNLFGPVVLSEETKRRGLHLTYMGTGCIFTTTPEMAPRTEDDEPNFFGSSYSTVKGFTDRLMKYYDDNVLNCRIRMPISHDLSPRNFIVKITSYKKIHSVTNSMTVLEDILPLMIQMACRKVSGTFNMTNPGGISHNEILEMYRDIVDKDFKWENFNEQELLSILKAGRSNNILDTSKIEKECPSILPIKEAVRQTLVKMASLKKQEKA